MKKTLAVAGALCIAMGSFQTAAQAHDWFTKYERGDRDHHWTFDEFRDAHHAWWLRHRRERNWSDAELRSQFDSWDPEHRGWVTRQHLERFHHW